MTREDRIMAAVLDVFGRRKPGAALRPGSYIHIMAEAMTAAILEADTRDEPTPLMVLQDWE